MNKQTPYNAVNSSDTAQIERGIENTREKLSDTLHELKDKASPRQLADRAVRFAKDSGAPEMARGVGRTVRDHPVPFLLVGAGLGWLVASRLRSRSDTTEDVAGRLAQDSNATYPDVRLGARSNGAAAPEVDDEDVDERLYEAGEQAGEKLTETLIQAREKLGEARDSAARVASGIADRSGEWAGAARRGAQRGWSYATDEQPLILLGVGLAAGTALGLALPRSRSEERLLGSHSAALQSRARDAAQSQYERAKSAARDTYDTVMDDLDRRGLSAEGLRGAAGAAAEQARTALGGDESGSYKPH